MSKRYQRKLCAYCAEADSTTADHVFAREFFLQDNRAGLPQVPACETCNSLKSRVEHYLTTVLPFGGRHREAHRNLVEMVPKRLAKNAKLHRTLRDNWGRVWAEEAGIYIPVSTLPVSAENVERLFEYIVRGLMVFHWGAYLGHANTVKVMALTKAGDEYFDGLFALTASARVRNDLGQGTFVYQGAQAVDLPEISVWRIELYGGLKFGNPAAPGEVATKIGALTGPRSANERA